MTTDRQTIGGHEADRVQQERIKEWRSGKLRARTTAEATLSRIDKRVAEHRYPSAIVRVLDRGQRLIG